MAAATPGHCQGCTGRPGWAQPGARSHTRALAPCPGRQPGHHAHTPVPRASPGKECTTLPPPQTAVTRTERWVAKRAHGRARPRRPWPATAPRETGPRQGDAPTRGPSRPPRHWRDQLPGSGRPGGAPRSWKTEPVERTWSQRRWCRNAKVQRSQPRRSPQVLEARGGPCRQPRTQAPARC
jgi:hypothetical protein